jgi:creatinine amidohydrolase/Fe(II)-dependent formamide hydrolase-like protein
MADFPFILSIEDADGSVKRHGYHLGTDLRLAKQIAEEMFDARGARTVALIPSGIGGSVWFFDFRREWYTNR